MKSPAPGYRKEWQTPDGQKAIEIMGWPTWDAREIAQRMLTRYKISDARGESYEMWGCLEAVQLGDGEISPYWLSVDPKSQVDDHVAACLLRDHARTWLEERGELAIAHYGRIWNLSRWARGGVDPRETIFDCFDQPSYDAALIAAILAVGKKD